MIPGHGPFAYSGSSSLRTSSQAQAQGRTFALRLEGPSRHWQCSHWQVAGSGGGIRAGPQCMPVSRRLRVPSAVQRVRAITRGASPSCQYWMLAQQWNCTMAGARGIRRPRDLQPRPGNPQFPPPRFPIWPGNGEGTSDSRLGRERESGNPPFSRFGPVPWGDHCPSLDCRAVHPRARLGGRHPPPLCGDSANVTGSESHGREMGPLSTGPIFKFPGTT
jgi:hypothetical protein